MVGDKNWPLADARNELLGNVSSALHIGPVVIPDIFCKTRMPGRH